MHKPERKQHFSRTTVYFTFVFRLPAHRNDTDKHQAAHADSKPRWGGAGAGCHEREAPERERTRRRRDEHLQVTRIAECNQVKIRHATSLHCCFTFASGKQWGLVDKHVDQLLGVLLPGDFEKEVPALEACRQFDLSRKELPSPDHTRFEPFVC